MESGHRTRNRVDGLKEVRDFLGALLYPLLEEPPAMYTGQMTRRKRNRVVAEFQAIKKNVSQEKLKTENGTSSRHSDGGRKKRTTERDAAGVSAKQHPDVDTNENHKKRRADGEDAGTAMAVDDDQPGSIPTISVQGGADADYLQFLADDQPGAPNRDGQEHKEANASQNSIMASSSSNSDDGWSSDEENSEEQDEGNDSDYEPDDDAEWAEKKPKHQAKKRQPKHGKDDKSGKDPKEEESNQEDRDAQADVSERQHIFSSKRRVLCLSNAGSEALTLTAGDDACMCFWLVLKLVFRHAGHQLQPALCADGLGTAGEPRAPDWQRQGRLRGGSRQWRCVVRGSGVNLASIRMDDCMSHSGT